MIEINKIKDFITSRFDVATLSGKTSGDKLSTRLSLSGGINDKYEAISSYGMDIKGMRKNEAEMANYLLNCFLDNKIIEVKYNCYVPHYKCSGVRIESDRQTLYLAFNNCLKQVFPKLLSRIEQVKRESIFKIFADRVDEIKELSINSYSSLHSGIDLISEKFKYSILWEKDKEGKKVIYPNEIALIRSLIKEFINSIDFDDNYNPIDYLLHSIDLEIHNAQKDYRNNSKYYLLDVGNKRFYTEDEQVLEIFKEVLIELQPLYEVSPSKQLIMKI